LQFQTSPDSKHNTVQNPTQIPAIPLRTTTIQLLFPLYPCVLCFSTPTWSGLTQVSDRLAGFLTSPSKQKRKPVFSRTKKRKVCWYFAAMVKSSESGVAPFLKKCYEMVDDESTNSIISWSQTNDSFVIWDMTEFSVHLLPKYFKHSNSSSFVRQLNIYVSFLCFFLYVLQWFFSSSFACFFPVLVVRLNFNCGVLYWLIITKRMLWIFRISKLMWTIFKILG